MPFGVEAVALGLCWPNRSSLVGDIELTLGQGETLVGGVHRLGLSWSPAWLLEAGYRAVDCGGTELLIDTPATRAGPVEWLPTVRTGRLDDQTADSVTGERRDRRLRGELAVLALWERACQSLGVADDIRPGGDLPGGTRGTRFRDLLVYTPQGTPRGLARRTRDPSHVDPRAPHAPGRGRAEQRHRRRRTGQPTHRGRVLEVDVAL